MQINFRDSIGSLDSSKITQKAPFNGKINQVIIHFPPGCSSLVEVRVFHGLKSIVPESGYIAMDDSTPPFSLSEPVKLGDPITVEMINHDDTYSHTISVVVGFEKVTSMSVG